MSALVWEGGIHRQAWFCMDTRFWSRGLKNGQEQIFCLRMGYSAGSFALLAANAAFRMYEDGFHTYYFLSPSRMKRTIESCSILQGTSSLSIHLPQKHKKTGQSISELCLSKTNKPFTVNQYSKCIIQFQLTNVIF